MDKNDKIIVLNLAVMACNRSNTSYTSDQIIEYARDFEKYVLEGTEGVGQNKVFASFAKKA